LWCSLILWPFSGIGWKPGSEKVRCLKSKGCSFQGSSLKILMAAISEILYNNINVSLIFTGVYNGNRKQEV
ncbi:MAG: hypothetical protein KHZ23_00990, partial [Dialister sp.]|nr:hypothetical protein [Dialister sp.]